MNTLELRIPPLTLVLVTAAAMCLIAWGSPSLTWNWLYSSVVALALAVAGCAVAILGVRAFRQARTTVNPTRPQTASSLVGSGIYRVSRNPMYLGFLLVLLAWAVFLSNLLSIVLVPIFVGYMNRFQIGPEERALLALFGEEFTGYCREVRRWL
jgi:protein-S-isoprenylcysteine O-methyltransferase Ste14